MAGNDALIASLLLGQRQKRDPLEIYQSFGRQQAQAGSSTAPLGSGNALEGIARALQGGLGGLMQGWAIGEQEKQDTATGDSFRKMALAKSPEEFAAASKGVRGMEGNAVLGQIAQARLDQLMAQQQAGAKLGPLMGGAMPGAPQAGPMPQGGGAAPPLNTAAPATPGTPQSGYSLANNPGNIRATALPWDNKGAPQNGFETFATPQDGANAQFKNFAAYVQANPNITVAQALAKWSPPNENNTQGIISQISEATGINPGMPLAQVLQDPALAATLLDAQARLEKGGLPQGFSADTFMTAAGAPSQPPAPGAPGPIAQAPPQGSGNIAINQGPPTAMSSPAGDQLRQRAQAAQQAGDNVTALKYAQEAAQEDAKWATKIGEKNVDQVEEERRHQRGLQDKAANLTQATPAEMEKLRTARAEGASIVAALQDFKREFEKGSGVRSLLGAATPANTAYNNATLLMKGEALYNLGVLSGPDLEIIRRILPDPSTFAGQNTSKEEMNISVGKITDLINRRISEKERSLGLGQSAPTAAPSAPMPGSGAPGASGGGIPAPPPGFRPL